MKSKKFRNSPETYKGFGELLLACVPACLRACVIYIHKYTSVTRRVLYIIVNKRKDIECICLQRLKTNVYSKIVP